VIGRERFDGQDTGGSGGAWMRRTSCPVVLSHVDGVGLRVAACLLAAGYAVFGEDVSAEALPGFEAAGGRLLADEAAGSDAFWSIDCQAKDGLHPEALAMMASVRSGSGRPRVEITGSQSDMGARGTDPVATLTLRPPGDSHAELSVVVGVRSRGPELTVQGGHTLFEEALPLLTALADRVLYAGPGRDTSS
jgi:hypothetical protein